MRKARKLLLLLVMFLAFAISPSFALTSQTQKDIQAIGTISYPNPDNPLLIQRHIYQNWIFSPQLRAASSDFWIGHWDAVDQAVDTKKIRSDFLAFLYANIRERFPTGTNDPPNTFDMFMKNGWFLKDQNGNYVRSTDYGSYIVDVGDPAVQHWYANWIKGYLDTYGLDGVELDNCLASSEILWDTSPSPINPRTGSVWTDQEFNDAVIAFVNNVKDTIGSRIVFGNGVWNGNHFYNPSQQQWYINLLNSKIDGIMSEGWISSGGSVDWYSEGDWLKSINFATWIEDNFLSKGNKIFLTISENAGLPENPLPDGSYPTLLPSGVTREQYVTYVFASRLLAAKSNGNYVNFGYYMPADYPQSLFKIGLGNPLGTYYVLNGTHVYSRDFSKVKILVNPTSESYSVSLEGSYQTIDGARVTSPIDVVAHTGIILEVL